LKASARNSMFTVSVIFVLFTTDKSWFVWNGPRKTLRPRVPSAEKPVLDGSEQLTMTFWSLTHRPPEMNASRLTKLSSRSVTLPEVRMLPEPTVSRLPLMKSVSCSENEPKSAIRNGVPDWNVLTPLTDQPSTSLRGQLLNHLPNGRSML